MFTSSRQRFRHRSIDVAFRALAAAGTFSVSLEVRADPQPVIWNGVPQQVVPTYSEVGLGAFSLPTGSGTGSGPGASTGADDPSGTGSSSDTAGSADASTASGSDNTALNTMLAQSWGAAAAANATAVGVTATSLSTVCVVESGCQNVRGTGTVAGAFQMTASTYTSMINAALQQNPNLAQNIVPGLAGQMDPATESIAASEYLLQGAQALKNADITNPTNLQVRGYYNFGPNDGIAIAQASDSEVISTLLPDLTSRQMQQNGITPGVTTIGQWRAKVSSTIGSAASQPVLISGGTS